MKNNNGAVISNRDPTVAELTANTTLARPLHPVQGAPHPVQGAPHPVQGPPHPVQGAPPPSNTTYRLCSYCVCVKAGVATQRTDCVHIVSVSKPA